MSKNSSTVNLSLFKRKTTTSSISTTALFVPKLVNKLYTIYQQLSLPWDFHQAPLPLIFGQKPTASLDTCMLHTCYATIQISPFPYTPAIIRFYCDGILSAFMFVVRNRIFWTEIVKLLLCVFYFVHFFFLFFLSFSLFMYDICQRQKCYSDITFRIILS